MTVEGLAIDERGSPWAAYGAAIWALIFAVFHLVWAAGCYPLLNAEQARIAFAVSWKWAYDVAVAGMCVIAIPVALAPVTSLRRHVSRPLGFRLAVAGSVLLALRSIASLVQIGYLMATGRFAGMGIWGAVVLSRRGVVRCEHVAIPARSPSLNDAFGGFNQRRPRCGDPMSMHECVGAFIIQRESVLLGKRSADRSSYPNVWDVFGGHIEVGELRHQALERELFEELGILPARSRYLETASVPGSTPGAGTTCHFYLVTAWNGTPANRQPQEHAEVRWFQRDEVARLELASPEYKRIIDRVCRNAVDSY